MKKNLLTIGILSLFSSYLYAENVEVINDDGVTIYYNISKNTKTAEVTYKGSSYNDYSDEYKGEVVIPSSIVFEDVSYSVVSIGKAAFSECPSLTHVVIPNSVSKIGFEAFYKCSSLNNVVIPNSVESTDMCVFTYCSNLSNITLPDTWTSINSRMFESCTSLKNIQLPSSLISLSSSVFMDSGIETLSIPESVTSLGDALFYRCENLKELYIYSKKAPTIGQNVFVGSNPTIHTLIDATGYNNEPWSSKSIINDLKPQCSKPTITFLDNKLSFACSTEGASFIYTITDTDVTTASVDKEANLSLVYSVEVYATADGYSPSEKTYETINLYSQAITDTVYIDSIVEVYDTIYIYDDSHADITLTTGETITITVDHGIISIKNAPVDSNIIVYTIDGEMVEMRKVRNEELKLELERNNIYLIKIGDNSFKIKL